MSRPGCLRWILALAHLSTGLFAASQPALTEFHCRIVFQPGHQASVLITAEVADPERLPQRRIEHSLVSYEGQRILGLHFNSEGRKLDLEAHPGTRLTRYAVVVPPTRPAGAGFRYQAEYTVASAPEDESERVPLLVPSLPALAGARAVQIQAQIPDYEVPLRDTFPHFLWQPPGSGSVTLGNVPAFVRVRRKRAGAVSVRDRLEDPIFLSDLFIILIIVLGSITWKMKYSRK